MNIQASIIEYLSLDNQWLKKVYDWVTDYVNLLGTPRQPLAAKILEWQDLTMEPTRDHRQSLSPSLNVK